MSWVECTCTSRDRSVTYPPGQVWGEDRRLEAERLARAFIWAGLSNTLFVNASSTALSTLLEPLREWDDIAQLSWGEAGLAEMYLALDDVSRGEASSFHCFQMAFEVHSALLLVVPSISLLLFPFIELLLKIFPVLISGLGL